MPDSRYWDDVYDAWRSTTPYALWRRHSDAVDAAWLRTHLPANGEGRLLKTDLFNEGISEGLYSILAPSAGTVFGIDISPRTALAAHERYTSLETAAADVRHIPFADGVFDVVVSNSTLDHFEATPDIVAGVEEIHRVLRPGGQLLISMDNPVNPFVALRNGAPESVLRRLRIVPYYVGATFGPATLRRTLEDRGFAVESAGSILHCPRVIAVAACQIVERIAGPAVQKRVLDFLATLEGLRSLPTRYLTGHFVVASARKRHG